jgi:hypothetical protein
MNNIKLVAFVLVLLIVSISCNFITGLPPGETQQPQATATKVESLVASGNGPQGLSAQATSADSVMLSWQTVEGAVSYHIMVSTNGGEALTVIDLASSATSYEDFLVSPNSQMTYAVEHWGILIRSVNPLSA